MKTLFTTITALFSFTFAQSSSTVKELILNFNNPVEMATNYIADTFVNAPLETSIIYAPENSDYPIDYSFNYEVETGNENFVMNNQKFRTEEDVHTFEKIFKNAAEIAINFTYLGTTDDVHRAKWILKHIFNQELSTYIEFDLKKEP